MAVTGPMAGRMSGRVTGSPLAPPEGAGFSPANLFAASEQGAWYDPSDLTTLFTLSSGLPQVAADGNAVGLMLDKRLWGGRTLPAVLAAQSEMLPTPSAAASSVGWGRVAGGAPASLDAGVFTAVGTGSGTITSGPDLGVQAGQTVQFRIRIKAPSGSHNVNLTWRRTSALGVSLTGDRTITVTTSYVEYTGFLVCAVTATDIVFGIRHSGTQTVEFEADVSVKSVPGNHASQGTTGNRPFYKTAGGLRWLLDDEVNDTLPVTLPDLGTDATVWYATEDGVTISGAQTISGAFETLRGERTYAVGVIDRALTVPEENSLTSYLAGLAPA